MDGHDEGMTSGDVADPFDVTRARSWKTEGEERVAAKIAGVERDGGPLFDGRGDLEVHQEGLALGHGRFDDDVDPGRRIAQLDGFCSGRCGECCRGYDEEK